MLFCPRIFEVRLARARNIRKLDSLSKLPIEDEDDVEYEDDWERSTCHYLIHLFSREPAGHDGRRFGRKHNVQSFSDMG
jgi:hypothetical protein